MKDFWIDFSFEARKWGVLVGFILMAIPIIYDLVGMLYGRDARFKIENLGVCCQIVGLFIGSFGWLSKWVWR